MVLEGMEWIVGEKTMMFKAADSDPNVWKLVEVSGDYEDIQLGVMLVYVDDLLILGPIPMIQACLERVAGQWAISDPEWLNDLKPVRFLGIDMWRSSSGIFVNQSSYIKDVLKRNGEEDGMKSGVPITKDQAVRLDEDDPEKTAEDVTEGHW